MTQPWLRCVVCGEMFWRVLLEPDHYATLCMECTVALGDGLTGALEARNQLAPWHGAPDDIQLMPLDWES